MVQQLDNQAKIELIAKIHQSIDKKPLNDLSKFTPRHDLVVGNSDDLVDISWEKELNFDLPC